MAEEIKKKAAPKREGKPEGAAEEQPGAKAPGEPKPAKKGAPADAAAAIVNRNRKQHRG